MKITRVEPFILHVPVTGSGIADSTHRLSHWGAPGVVLETDSGLRGYGYTGTHGHLATDRLIRDAIGQAFGPLLEGEDPLEVRALWQKLYSHPPIRWVGRAGIVQMALSAVDIALWDLKAKAAGVPLWKLLGGCGSKRLEAYNTDGGWLNWAKQQLVDSAKETVAEGFRGLKLKIGSPDPSDDLRRIEAVREAIGPGAKLMVDANGAWDLATAVRVGRHFAHFDVFWFEEPLAFDDAPGHGRLAQAIATPIALGEQLYSAAEFERFIAAGGVYFLQPDATRLGGVTGCWQACELAAMHHLPVVAHAADMMQVHVQVSIAHSTIAMLEYIPWLRQCFEEPATVEDGDVLVPQAPGAGTTLRADALERFGVE